jgi:predicted DsbA family dithiol-disulfide isomerase
VASGDTRLTLEIWSDVVCSWCYIGKRHLEQALAEIPERDEMAIRWRSFELDPSMAVDGGLADEELARRRGITLEDARAMHEVTERQGAELGIVFDFRRAHRGNTFDAHRVLHMAADHGVQEAVKERLLATYFTEGGAIGDRETVTVAAAQGGLDRAAVAAMLESERYADEVRADEREAAELGISAVPFFVIDRRYGLAGAQPPAILVAALHRALADRSVFT